MNWRLREGSPTPLAITTNGHMSTFNDDPVPALSSEAATRLAHGPWQRANPRTGWREIADAEGHVLAYCPSYLGGPSLDEAQANAELIASGRETLLATRGPWHAVPPNGLSMWLVRGGPSAVIVAMVRPDRPDAEEIAERIASRTVTAKAAFLPRSPEAATPDSCTVTRHVFVRSNDLVTGADLGAAWHTGPCGTPLFTAEERRSGTCRSCAKGWAVAHSFPVTPGDGFEVWAEKPDGSAPVLVTSDLTTEPTDPATLADLWLAELRPAGVFRVSVWRTEAGTAGRCEPFAGDGVELARSEAIEPARCPRCMAEVDGPHSCLTLDEVPEESPEPVRT